MAKVFKNFVFARKKRSDQFFINTVITDVYVLSSSDRQEVRIDLVEGLS